MVASRPVIFISAVSKELHSTRDLVAKTLISLGYEPKWQDIAPTNTGDLLAVLRKWIDGSQAVIQIVGHRYGAAPKIPDPAIPNCSYTQYEALYARQKGKPVWYIILDENHPVDPADPEPAELQQLQSDYRTQVRAHGHLYHPSHNLPHTENIVLRLRDDLAKLRRRARQWATFTIALLIFSLGGIGLTLLKQKDTGNQVIAVQQQNAELLAAVRALPAAVAQAQQSAPQENETARATRAYASLETSLKFPPGTLAKELPAFAENLLLRADTSEIDRANAHFATRQFAAAEAAALRAKDQSLAADPPAIKAAIAALLLAGQSTTELNQHKRALEHYRAAAALTSEARDVLEWATIQNKIGWLLHLDGQYDAGADLMHHVWQACENAGHQESSISLLSHHLWANALASQGKYAEAVQENRAVLAIRDRILGPEHPDTLATRNNLASALNFQGQHAEAEQEGRAVLAIQQRVLGPEHPTTLASRNNLANALYSQRKHAEAEQENRTVLAIQQRVLGPEHPDTMGSRNNLANALDAQGKHAEAEPENRAVLAIQERVYGPEHPEVFRSCYNLSFTLEKLGRKSEALQYARRALAGWIKSLGEEHPNSKNAKARVQRLERE